MESRKKTIVLCHGWGFDSRFWSPITKLFAKNEISILNLGYFNNESCIPEQDTYYLGIGHSFGVTKLLSLFGSRVSHLVVINGFVNFLGSTPTLRKKRARELESMILAFQREPHRTLRNFHTKVLETENSSHKQLPLGDINFTRLLSDLRNLTASTPIPKIPLLILGSQSDRIVPEEILHDNFSNQEIMLFERGGHNIVGTSPLAIYELIKDFLQI